PILDRLFEFGGFPEPFIKKSPRFLRRWNQDRIDLLVKDDIRSLEDVRDISLLMLLAQMLPTRVGSPLSINGLREDLEISHKSASRWITILEWVYYCYRIYPYQRSLVRSLKKEPKLYLWDWSELEDPGAKFENMIAGHLQKYVSYLKEYFGFNAELWYLRTVEKKEVDFLVTIKHEPWFAVEAKYGDQSPAKSLLYFKDKINIPFLFQVVYPTGIDVMKGDIRVISADKFLTAFI
ncbi:DUF4143 domain-containing protein, partial [bacterium]|nr:DUF4143 domain-containing protein [bacterium]